MVLVHDFEAYPELTNTQLETYQFSSPHKQINFDFSGVVVKVTDGDTITLKTSFRDFNFPLRIANIDAPEMNAGGGVAREWLKTKIEGQKVRVLVDPFNRVGRYGRLIGAVVYNGLVVGQTMIYLGLAKPFGRRNEGVIPPVSKLLDKGQWL